MSLDEASWAQLLDRLGPAGDAPGSPLAIAFIGEMNFVAKQGPAWLWWPGNRSRNPGPVAFDGRYPADWGLLLVMNDMAVAKVGADGTAIMSHLVRHLDIKPFILRQRDELDASGILDFIETLELATPKH